MSQTRVTREPWVEIINDENARVRTWPCTASKSG